MPSRGGRGSEEDDDGARRRRGGEEEEQERDAANELSSPSKGTPPVWMGATPFLRASSMRCRDSSSIGSDGGLLPTLSPLLPFHSLCLPALRESMEKINVSEEAPGGKAEEEEEEEWRLRGCRGGGVRPSVASFSPSRKRCDTAPSSIFSPPVVRVVVSSRAALMFLPLSGVSFGDWRRIGEAEKEEDHDDDNALQFSIRSSSSAKCWLSMMA